MERTFIQISLLIWLAMAKRTQAMRKLEQCIYTISPKSWRKWRNERLNAEMMHRKWVRRSEERRVGKEWRPRRSRQRWHERVGGLAVGRRRRRGQSAPTPR